MKEKELIKNLLIYSEISMLVYELYSNNLEQAKKYIEDPNEFLFGKTALEVCLIGEGEGLRDWLLGRLDK